MAKPKNEPDIKQDVAYVSKVGTHVTVWYDANERIDYEDQSVHELWLKYHPITMLIDFLKRR